LITNLEYLLLRTIARFIRLPLLTCCAVTFSAALAANAEEIGTHWTGERGIQEKTSEIMAREEQRGEKTRPVHQRLKPDFQNLLPNPDSPDSPTWPPPDGSPGSQVTTPGNPQTLGLNFTGATLAETGAFPPDTMGAVGPTQFIVALNGRIRSFNKNTGSADGALNVDPDVFFQSVMTPPASNNFTSDPRIRYDRLSGRWFIIIIDVPGRTGSNPNRVLLAVSDGSTISPSTVWTFFYFGHDQVSPVGDSGKFADYPTLGIDANALYIGINVFGTRGVGSFSGTTGFVVRKSSILSSGPIVVTAFRNLVVKSQGILVGLYTPQGVDNYDPAATEGYFVGVDPSYSGRIHLRRITNPGGDSPAISSDILINVPATGGTMSVPHLGNTGGTPGNLDGLDIRLIAAHVRNGRLWTTANLAVNNVGSPSGTDTRNGVRWYELGGIHSGQTPSVIQSGTVYHESPNNTSDQRHYWMGTIMVSGQGHAAMGFSVAGAQERINAGVVGRLASDPLGTMRTPVLYTASTTAYNPPSDPGSSEGRRWGDYSYTSLDPDDDMTIWTVQEFCNAQNSYGVRVVRLLAPPPATPVSCSPASLGAGSSNVVVALTGTVTNGSGFFEPGLGFSNHIAATFGAAGVIVNSVQYIDPSHLTLNVTVAGNASSGAHTLTVTNPDGQAVSSASGLLTVTGGNTPPTIGNVSDHEINEDSATPALSFTVGDAETSVGSLTVSGTSSNTNLVPQTGIAFSGSGATRMVTITPTPDEFGSTTITITVTDAMGGTASDMFLLTVTPVNDQPSFTKGVDQMVFEDSGSQTITNWASGIVAGPTNEVSQSLSFIVSNNNNALFAVQPAIASDGTLSYTPATNTFGSATVTVQLHDDGGTANGGIDISSAQTFNVTIVAVNDPPLLAPIATATITEGDTLTVTNIGTDVDSPLNALAYSMVGSPVGMSINTSSGLLTWTPTEAQGPSTNTVMVVVADNGSPTLSATQSFTVVVNEVNSAPVLPAIANRIIHQGATITFTNLAIDSDLPANGLTYSLSNAPAGASIGASTGIFIWTPTVGQVNTTNDITIVVADDGAPNLSDSESVTITVHSPPLISSISLAETAVTISWTAIAQTTYVVQYKSTLEEVTWHDLPGDVVASSSSASKTDTLGADSQRFYRIFVAP
jgi:hypothetical protein